LSELKTTCETVVFCSSAGHCQLDCEYCIIHPVVKREPSIVYEDLRFFLDTVGTRVFFIFSGKGDFFAGYPKRDRFLERLLDHDVEVALDVNGVLLNEYPELPETKLAKIRAINLTLHYKQLKDKRVEKVWAANARTVLEKHRGELILGTILSPLLSDLWEEGLVFYRETVFEATGRKIWMIRDCDRPYDPAQEMLFSTLLERFAGMVEKEHRDDFAGAFAGHEAVLCPAGRDYFRIWNDGRVQGCPWVPDLADLGNVKERRLARRSGPFRCTTARFCDCYDIHQLGKMGYEAASEALPAHPGSTGR
jgi:MoaA/NifB/PqqE/SkfB family radical SAM enzyme